MCKSEQGTSTAHKDATNLTFHWVAKFSASLCMSVNGHLHYGTYGSTGIPTSDGTINAATFSGDLNGTINTATTGVTQTVGNNSTKIATTAFVAAAVAAGAAYAAKQASMRAQAGVDRWKDYGVELRKMNQALRKGVFSQGGFSSSDDDDDDYFHHHRIIFLLCLLAVAGFLTTVFHWNIAN